MQAPARLHPCSAVGRSVVGDTTRHPCAPAQHWAPTLGRRLPGSAPQFVSDGTPIDRWLLPLLKRANRSGFGWSGEAPLRARAGAGAGHPRAPPGLRPNGFPCCGGARSENTSCREAVAGSIRAEGMRYEATGDGPVASGRPVSATGRQRHRAQATGFAAPPTIRGHGRRCPAHPRSHRLVLRGATSSWPPVWTRDNRARGAGFMCSRRT